ncbi:MAG: hypothetical protein QM756_22050 [Polyangiaceae bacterium]
MKVVRRAIVPRDQAASPFSGILLRLCDATGAHAAALVDAEGETVDYAGRVEPFDIRVAAAEWRLALSVLTSAAPAWSETSELVVRCSVQSFAVWALSDGYALVMVLPRRAFRVSKRALAEAMTDLAREAGLSSPADTARVRWARVEVQTEDGGRRPRAVWQDGAWRPLTISGPLSVGRSAARRGRLPDAAAIGRRMAARARAVRHLVRWRARLRAPFFASLSEVAAHNSPTICGQTVRVTISD